MRAVTGRVRDIPGFAVLVLLLFLLLQVVPAVLVTWALDWGSADGARGAQLAWGVGLAVAVVAGLVRWSMCGTESTWDGLVVRSLFETRTVPWTSVVGFTTVRNGVRGNWMHAVLPTGKPEPPVRSFPLPHPFAPRGNEDGTVAALNRLCGTGPPDRGGREDAGEYWGRIATLAWMTLMGCSAPIAVAQAALVSGKRWLLVAAAAVGDVLVVLILLHRVLGPGPVTVAAVAVVLGSGAVPVVFWLRGSHRRHTGGEVRGR